LYGEVWATVSDTEPSPREFYEMGDSPEVFVAGAMEDDGVRPRTVDEFFLKYQRAYLAAQLDPSDARDDEQIRTWEAYARVAGKRAATQTYWKWMSTLPREYASDVDPYG
jgi:hypothetical protein